MIISLVFLNDLLGGNAIFWFWAKFALHMHRLAPWPDEMRPMVTWCDPGVVLARGLCEGAHQANEYVTYRVWLLRKLDSTAMHMHYCDICRRFFFYANESSTRESGHFWPWHDWMEKLSLLVSWKVSSVYSLHKLMIFFCSERKICYKNLVKNERRRVPSMYLQWQAHPRNVPSEFQFLTGMRQSLAVPCVYIKI